MVLPVLASCGGDGAGDAAALSTSTSATPVAAQVPATSTTLAVAASLTATTQRAPATTQAAAPSPSTTRPATAPATTVALGPEWTQQDGFVLIEAVASGDAATLLRDLQALGLRDGVAVGRVVNGWLPVVSFESAQRLASLQFVRPTGAGTG